MNDSTLDTLKHSRRVDELLLQTIVQIQDRLTKHDASKMEDPEKAIFDEFSPKLSQLEYGSEEYKASLAAMKPALDHHYAENRHHPEHFEDGIAGMTLVDLVEMLADWRAATERNKNGDLAKSLVIQKDRFGISDQLAKILENTAFELGWITPHQANADKAPEDLIAANSEILDLIQGGKKIHAIKALRDLAPLGLKEAKEAVDMAESRLPKKPPAPSQVRRKDRPDRTVHGTGSDIHGSYEVVRYDVSSKFFVEYVDQDRRRQVTVQEAAEAAHRGFVGRRGGSAFDRVWMKHAGL